jgi:hypothetical protein
MRATFKAEKKKKNSEIAVKIVAPIYFNRKFILDYNLTCGSSE